MKTSAYLIFTIALGFIFASSQVQAQSQKTNVSDFIGTWNYTSQEAPYAYQEGQFVITQEDGAPSVDVLFSNGQEVEGENVRIENQQLKFGLYVETEYVSIQLERKEDKITGHADTTDDVIALTAMKES
ncbi:hypothetical protein [Fodinibius salsisoli]|uniref:Lipocalin-like domain-containing protein n=1 Tax=Fodinibius salsisoli TaxID=2820877 RepID=A0ABT3PL45_9BACT|nr:hypothetical protein [Fodinibius salsisoli]MCW9706637.1 hypothetical protein [Fodinibius salsisoli]